MEPQAPSQYEKDRAAAEMELFMLENKDRWTQGDYQYASELRATIRKAREGARDEASS